MKNESRRRLYDRIAAQLAELLEATDDRTAHSATAAALLHHKVAGVSWTGFYFLKHGELVVDAYQGPLACQVLERHTGVCWAAVDSDSTQLVADVHAFPGHIPCDGRSRSELVVPIHDREGTVIGVLDVDSHQPAHFDDIDARGCETVVATLEKRWNG